MESGGMGENHQESHGALSELDENRIWMYTQALTYTHARAHADTLRHTLKDGKIHPRINNSDHFSGDWIVSMRIISSPP